MTTGPLAVKSESLTGLPSGPFRAKSGAFCPTSRATAALARTRTASALRTRVRLTARRVDMAPPRLRVTPSDCTRNPRPGRAVPGDRGRENVLAFRPWRMEASMRAIPSSGRSFLVGTASLTAGLMLPRLADAQPAPSRPLVPRETFFDDPDVASAQISFDGAWVAYVAPVDGVRNLWVAPVGDLAAARPLTRVTDRPIGSFFQWAYTNRHVVFWQERDGDENWRASSVDIHDGTIVPLTPPRGVRSWLLEVSRRSPREMLISHNERDKQFFDLFRIDVVTGKSSLVYENPQFAWLGTDTALQLRLASRYRKDGSVEVLERRPSGAWVPFMSIPRGEVEDRKSTRLNSSHGYISYAVFCLKKKKTDPDYLCGTNSMKLRVFYASPPLSYLPFLMHSHPNENLLEADVARAASRTRDMFNVPD